jgi:hypothetical protein
MLTSIRALEEWRLEGLQWKGHFSIDMALEYFMSTKKLNARKARWAELLSRFYYIIRYRPGKQNLLANALSLHENEEIDTAKHR